MLKKETIRHLEPPYSSSLWVVPKKLDASGKRKWRIVIDFRKINEITDQDAYPFPINEDILNLRIRVGAAKEGATPGTQDDLAGKDFENTSKKPGLLMSMVGFALLGCWKLPCAARSGS